MPETSSIPLYSTNYFLACTVGGVLACGYVYTYTLFYNYSNIHALFFLDPPILS